MEGWKEYKLGDLLIDKGYIRGPFGSALRRPELKSSGIPVYEQQHAIYNTRVFRFFIDEPKFKELKRFQVRPNDLIISCSGTVGKISIIGDKDPLGIISQALLILSVNKDLISSKFLFFFLTNPKGNESLLQASHGSVQVNIAQRSTVENIDLLLPPLPLQHRIAEILGALDDKIELNRQMNQTLEQMAQALYKHYFVDDIDPENLPEGWRNYKIRELIDSSIGGDWGHDKLNEEFCVPVKIIRGTDFENVKCSNLKSLPFRYIKQGNFIKRQLIPDDIVLEISGGSTDQPTGRSISMTDVLINRFSGKVVPASFCRLIRPISSYASVLQQYLQFLYDSGGTWMYQNQSTGLSNFQYSYFIDTAEIPIPQNLETIGGFNNKIRSFNTLIGNNIVESEHLISTRDYLLPKLISGDFIPSDLQTIEQTL